MLWNFQMTRSSYSKHTFLTLNSLFLLETHFSYSKLAFLTRNSLFLLETRFSYSKLTFLTRNSLFLLETHFSYSKLAFLTRNSLFLLETHFLLLETHFSYSKLAFITRNSLFLLETHFLLLETRFSYSKLTFLTRNSLPTKSESLLVEGIQGSFVWNYFKIGPRVYDKLSFKSIVNGRRTKTDHKSSPCHYGTGELKMPQERSWIVCIYVISHGCIYIVQSSFFEQGLKGNQGNLWIRDCRWVNNICSDKQPFSA